MSELETSAFTGTGFDTFPSIYSDNQIISECSNWEDERIERVVQEYTTFLERDDLQPRARAGAERILDHLGFEMDYRMGAYDYLLECGDE